MDVHISDDEEWALSSVFVKMPGKGCSAGFPDLLHIKTKAAGVVVTFRVNVAKCDLRAILECYSKVH
jgi:hypothetical protein